MESPIISRHKRRPDKPQPAICLLCSFFTLLIGFIIYIFFRQGTYIHTVLQNLFGLSLPYLPLGGILGTLVRNWGGDFFWGMALCFMLAAVLNPFRHKHIFAVALTVALGALLEILQFYGVITGTGDFFDIVSEATAAVCAANIIKRGNL